MGNLRETYLIRLKLMDVQCKYNALTKMVQKYNMIIERGVNMATTNFTMRIDEAVKAQLQELMNDLGLDMSSYFTMAAKQAIREQRIPFSVSREIPNQETLEAFKEVEELKKHPEKAKSYNSFSELLQEVKQDV